MPFTLRNLKDSHVVLRGSGRMKVDDDIVELREWDAVRVPPGTWRGYEAGPEGLEILVIGAPNLGARHAKTSMAGATGGLTSACRVERRDGSSRLRIASSVALPRREAP